MPKTNSTPPCFGQEISQSTQAKMNLSLGLWMLHALTFLHATTHPYSRCRLIRPKNPTDPNRNHGGAKQQTHEIPSVMRRMSKPDAKLILPRLFRRVSYWALILNSPHIPCFLGSKHPQSSIRRSQFTRRESESAVAS